MIEERAVLTFRQIPGLEMSHRGLITGTDDHEPPWRGTARLSFCSSDSSVSVGKFSCISMAQKRNTSEFAPSQAQLMKHPLAALAYVPRDVAIFLARAIAEAAVKTVMAPLDLIKILRQTHGVRVGQQESAKAAIGFVEVCHFFCLSFIFPLASHGLILFLSMYIE
ncbi:probable envelope ADP,ATP carrier protein, chloroplastic isoform X1 [Tripterygium wilfordii]|uniref:probable envelope ADP,ATP carrier protein, chloroplastic isoform X1 n=1 Tax=Tripterygium wilfordii TaxID=458696 RepID=UPI0018F7EA2A|nr:probable envelope ADP,ATP carrier protein, chloroplastic isoform X1 [Tripterygium wilfordii]